MVSQDMSYHQDPAFFLCQLYELSPVVHGDSQRLFNEGIFTGFQRSLGHFVVCGGRRRDRHGGHGIVRKNLGHLSMNSYAGILLRESIRYCLAFIAYGTERTEAVEVPDQ